MIITFLKKKEEKRFIGYLCSICTRVSCGLHVFGALEIENIDSFYLFVMLFMNSFSSFIEAAVI